MNIIEVCKMAKCEYGTRIDQEYWGCLMINVTLTDEQILWLLESNKFPLLD
jgi:hypothetical protein